MTGGARGGVGRRTTVRVATGRLELERRTTVVRLLELRLLLERRTLALLLLRPLLARAPLDARWLGARSTVLRVASADSPASAIGDIASVARERSRAFRMVTSKIGGYDAGPGHVFKKRSINR